MNCEIMKISSSIKVRLNSSYLNISNKLKYFENEET